MKHSGKLAALIIVGIIAFIFISKLIMSKNESHTKSISVYEAKKLAEAQEQSEPTEFNTIDKEVKTNKNFHVANLFLDTLSLQSAMKISEETRAEEITKNPYSYLGRLMRMRGKIYKIEQLPPSDTQKRPWAEILLFANNRNSLLGASNVSFVYRGDISKVNSGDIIYCIGYFCGVSEGENAMGGTVEILSIVGNAYKMIHRRLSE